MSISTQRLWSGALLCLLLTLGAAGCGTGEADPRRLASSMEQNLTKVMTVEGRVTISASGVVLLQELWVQRPDFLRTETEEGPGAFQGTIIVLNEKEGWFYNPALNQATVVDRSNYSAEMGLVGGSTLLEVIPQDVLAALTKENPIQVVGSDIVAGRDSLHVEVVLAEKVGVFSPGALNVWLDKEFFYPLRIKMSNGMDIAFQAVRYNREIDPVTFIFVPPPGATVRRIQN